MLLSNLCFHSKMSAVQPQHHLVVVIKKKHNVLAQRLLLYLCPLLNLHYSWVTLIMGAHLKTVIFLQVSLAAFQTCLCHLCFKTCSFFAGTSIFEESQSITSSLIFVDIELQVTVKTVWFCLEITEWTHTCQTDNFNLSPNTLNNFYWISSKSGQTWV